MRSEFYSIYDDLLVFYKRGARGNNLVSSNEDWLTTISQEVDGIAREIEIEDALRPDARLFLVINFNELVFRPIETIVNGSSISDPLKSNLRDTESLKNDLIHDIKIILSASRRSARSVAYVRGEYKISGHDIINAISKNWHKLNLLRSNVWG